MSLATRRGVPTTLTIVGDQEEQIAFVELSFPGRSADSIDAYQR